MSSKKIAVILSGCGHLDGTEITEAVSLLIALHQQGATPVCFAPLKTFEPVDHRSQSLEGEKRDVLIESARIARGQIQDLSQLHSKNFEALALPGGYGAAKNLCDWAQKGAAAEVHPEVTRVIKEFYSEGKPIGAMCIAPVLLAKTLGKKGITLTIGNEPETAAEIQKTGALHEECPVDDYVTDREHKIITTPAYMYQTTPDRVFKGISGLVKELVEMA